MRYFIAEVPKTYWKYDPDKNRVYILRRKDKEKVEEPSDLYWDLEMLLKDNGLQEVTEKEAKRYVGLEPETEKETGGTVMVSYGISESTITVMLDGECHVIPRNSEQKEIITQLLNDPRIQTDRNLQDRLRTALDKAKAIEEETEGNVKVVGNRVLYRGQEWDLMITKKILEFMRNGDPVQGLMKFMDRMMDNLSRRVIEQLYPFLDHNHFQITPEGYFIGYKGVRDNYYDVRTNSVWNGPGAVPEPKDRQEVDDDPSEPCSYGYHVGTLHYAKNWGQRVMKVLVDPKDAVSVPYDHDYEKLRVTQYRVLNEVNPGEIERHGVSPLAQRSDYTRMPEVPGDADSALAMLDIYEKEELLDQMNSYDLDPEYIEFLQDLDSEEMEDLHQELKVELG